MNREVILAIETGIGGGSLSVLCGGSEIAFWKGADKISKSEDLLQNISNLLEENNIPKSDIKKIAVSRGPGSFTGVRVGIATAKGLQKGLKCQCTGVSVLEAMVLKAKKTGEVLTGFSIGKNEVCRQAFVFEDAKALREKDFPKISSINDFVSDLMKLKNCEVILDSDLYTKISVYKRDFEHLEIIDLDGNPSKYVGLRSGQIMSSEEILPIYAREARTA